MALAEAVIWEQYRAWFRPFAAEALEPLGLPEDIFVFLTRTGLPVDSRYELTPHAPAAFLERLEVKRYFHFRGLYLHFADLGKMGELVVGLDTKRHGVVCFLDEHTAPTHVNASLAQFVECFGTWQALYPQYREAVRQAMRMDPDFLVSDHREICGPHLDRLRKRLREIDPDALKWSRFFWRRMCEPDE